MTVSVAEPVMVSDIVASLRALPGGAVLPARPLVAVNHRYSLGDVPVPHDAEIAVIPPVAGG